MPTLLFIGTGAGNLGNYVLPISKCPASQSTSQVSNSLGKVTVLRQDEHISYSWMFLCHKRAHFRTEFSRSLRWQLMKVNRQRHSFEQEVLNETRLDISDTQRIFFNLQVTPNISNRSFPGLRREEWKHNHFTS